MDQGRCDWLLITYQPIPIGPIAKTIVYCIFAYTLCIFTIIAMYMKNNVNSIK